MWLFAKKKAVLLDVYQAISVSYVEIKGGANQDPFLYTL